MSSAKLDQRALVCISVVDYRVINDTLRGRWTPLPQMLPQPRPLPVTRVSMTLQGRLHEAEPRPVPGTAQHRQEGFLNATSKPRVAPKPERQNIKAFTPTLLRMSAGLMRSPGPAQTPQSA